MENRGCKMRKKDLEINHYYEVSIGNEITGISSHVMIGKLLEIIDKSPYRCGDLRQRYFFEFLHVDKLHFHNGLGSSTTYGRDNRCYFVTLRSIIREVDECEILAREL